MSILPTPIFFLLNVAEHENFLLINMKMPTIVGIFIHVFISRDSSCSAEFSMKKSLRPCGLTVQYGPFSYVADQSE